MCVASILPIKECLQKSIGKNSKSPSCYDKKFMLSVMNRPIACCSVDGFRVDLDFCGQICDNRGWMKWMKMRNWFESWKLSPAGNLHVVGLGSRCKHLAHQVFYTAGVIACRLNHCTSTYMYIWHITSLLLSETLSILLMIMFTVNHSPYRKEIFIRI